MATGKKPTLEELKAEGELRRSNAARLFSHIDYDEIKFVKDDTMHSMKRRGDVITGGIHSGLKWLLLETNGDNHLYIELNNEVLLRSYNV